MFVINHGMLREPLKLLTSNRNKVSRADASCGGSGNVPLLVTERLEHFDDLVLIIYRHLPARQSFDDLLSRRDALPEKISLNNRKRSIVKITCEGKEP